MKVLNVLVRRYLPLDGFDEAVAFYEGLIGQTARLRFDYPAYDLKLAQVASILFIAGSEESLRPFVATHATFMVDDIEGFVIHLQAIGAEVIEPPKVVPTGWNMLVRHPDGMQVEYVQHRDPNPADRLF
ncbi:VOC family protein [Chelatococcus reniformis]|uniref:Dioxygenase n=1 Tax=Chelatococcus reniformis TaxID=1494448 RepID=A0A916UV32_9HYPH|nr:VOC family protein [Chelatococcus reniformis]GGC89101.1 dioxygenase [Chelatococcus reniformis]